MVSLIRLRAERPKDLKIEVWDSLGNVSEITIPGIFTTGTSL